MGILVCKDVIILSALCVLFVWIPGDLIGTVLHSGGWCLCRTFLESEVSNTKLRGDLYDKMVNIDHNAPTAEEHSCRAVTKLRYMQVTYPPTVRVCIP